jgi:hypothetical protein
VSRIFIRLNTLAGPNAARAPLLERLLARAERIDAGTDWRHKAFQAVAGQTVMPGIGAAALCGELGPIEGGAVFIASPVHCEAGMVSVRMSANGLIGLDGAEASQLAQAFNQEFADVAQRLIAAPGGCSACSGLQPGPQPTIRSRCVDGTLDPCCRKAPMRRACGA